MLSSELAGGEQLPGGDGCFESAADHLVGGGDGGSRQVGRQVDLGDGDVTWLDDSAAREVMRGMYDGLGRGQDLEQSERQREESQERQPEADRDPAVQPPSGPECSGGAQRRSDYSHAGTSSTQA